MRLTVSSRTGKTTSELTQLRHQGNIPAIVYSQANPAEKITVQEATFEAIGKEASSRLSSNNNF